MKKRKILIPIIILITIIIIAIIIIVTKSKSKNDTGENENTNKAQTVIAPTKDLPDETTDITLYIGEKENYKQISAKYNDTAPKQEQIKRILEKIGIELGYKIEINNIEITNEKIVIDFKSTGAPVNDGAYFGGETQELFVGDYTTLVYRIFDSIKETLQKHFGENIKIYYVVDGKDMTFNNINPRLVIGKDIEYK